MLVLYAAWEHSTGWEYEREGVWPRMVYWSRRHWEPSFNILRNIRGEGVDKMSSRPFLPSLDLLLYLSFSTWHLRSCLDSHTTTVLTYGRWACYSTSCCTVARRSKARTSQKSDNVSREAMWDSLKKWVNQPNSWSANSSNRILIIACKSTRFSLIDGWENSVIKFHSST